VITESGGIGTVVASLRDMVAKSATFQEATNLSEEDLKDDCIGRIFYDVQILEDLILPDRPLSRLRPFVLIAEEDWTLTADGYGPVVRSLPTTRVAMLLTQNALYPASQLRKDIQDSVVHFRNFYGGILDDIRDLNGYDDYFHFQSMSLREPPLRTIRSKQTPDNDFWEVTIDFSVGVTD